MTKLTASEAYIHALNMAATGDCPAPLPEQIGGEGVDMQEVDGDYVARVALAGGYVAVVYREPTGELFGEWH